MDSREYEELCRRFIADKEGIPLAAVKSSRIPSMGFPDLPLYRHQIDLYWERETDIGRYLNIAEVKWRGQRKVTQETVVKLQQVKQDLAAHKAFVITNVGFTDGAVSMALNKGIALHVVQPDPDTFDLDVLIASPPPERGSLYDHRIIVKGVDDDEPDPRSVIRIPDQAKITRDLMTDPKRSGRDVRIKDLSSGSSKIKDVGKSFGPGKFRGGKF